jgi:hypothetical protein
MAWDPGREPARRIRPVEAATTSTTSAEPVTTSGVIWLASGPNEPLVSQSSPERVVRNDGDGGRDRQLGLAFETLRYHVAGLHSVEMQMSPPHSVGKIAPPSRSM